MNLIKTNIFILLLIAFASCRKPVEVIPEDEPVPILLSASVTGASETKASIEQWNDTEVNVFGLKREKIGYNYDDPSNIVDKTAIISSGGVVSLYSDENSKMPYYYAESEGYDFYAYHLGGASVSSTIYEEDLFAIDVILEGNNDLLYATTDPKKDLEGYDDTDLVYGHLYSAFSARRGIHPTLNFEHALSRFQFIVKGAGDKYSMFMIEGLEIEAVCSGSLVLGKGNVCFNPSEDVGVLKLKMSDDSPFVTAVITENRESVPLGGDGASIMFAPGSKSVKVTLKLVGENKMNYDYSFIVNSSDIKLTDKDRNTYYSDTFVPGFSYNIIISVYGLEKIEITSSLIAWKEDSFTVDPDDYEYPVDKPGSSKDDGVETGVSVGGYEEGGDLGSEDLN